MVQRYYIVIPPPNFHYLDKNYRQNIRRGTLKASFYTIDRNHAYYCTGTLPCEISSNCKRQIVMYKSYTGTYYYSTVPVLYYTIILYCCQFDNFCNCTAIVIIQISFKAKMFYRTGHRYRTVYFVFLA